MNGGMPTSSFDENNPNDNRGLRGHLGSTEQLEVDAPISTKFSESWKLLYRKMTPAILHPTIVNKHIKLLE